MSIYCSCRKLEKVLLNIDAKIYNTLLNSILVKEYKHFNENIKYHNIYFFM